MAETTILGESPPMSDMLAHVSALAPLERPVLIIGERGTGKELVANRLAYLSPRWQKPFLTINCGALAESVLDSELFGHEAGAFTGAIRRRASRFELADGGTLFLDEIGNASPAVQDKLLRILEYGTFSRVGGNDTVSVDVRIIAATNADLRNEKTFRPDLLDRLSFDVIAIPPLRERPGDILRLATHFAQRMTAELGRDFFAGFSPAAEAQLESYAWPGNVRELRNAVERSVYRHANPSKPLARLIIDPFGPPPASPPPAEVAPIAAPAPSTPLATNFRIAVDAYEKSLLTAAMIAARHNQKRAADSLQLSYHQFRNALKKHAI